MVPDQSERIAAFAAAVVRAGYAGDFETGIGARLVASTDNSIYQMMPAAVAYPRTGDDINLLVAAAACDLQTPIALTARGGNTGTNGQSLNGGVIVDFARHMNAIIAFDPAKHTVTVEPGVVLDQLNAMLGEHGLFFPPMVSTASRATIGGMVATDASGKGSRHYGKTSDYIEAIDVVLADGTDWRVRPISRAAAAEIAGGTGIVARIHREALRIVTDRAGEIAAVFPPMNRGLTGYNLQKLYDAEQDRFFLGYLLAGSEGTLAITKAVTLRVCAKPAVKALAVVRYADFAAGLRDVGRLIAADPLAIEILDDQVLGVAQTDIVWTSIGSILGDTGERPVRAMNFVEFAAADESHVAEALAKLTALLDQPEPGAIDWKIVRDPAMIAQLWTLREKSVGLLARLGGDRQGAPFVEDTAVPPHLLPAFVAEFRALLDGYGLQYGMFGHADVGCLHVRPFLDMKEPAQAALIRPISDAVAALTKRHGGLLWGEHGRGFRGEYSPLFFGGLYDAVRAIKQVFDPADMLNPGKLATPDGRPVDRIDGVPFRGEADREIGAGYLEDFDRSVACNGNGACFSWDAFDVMCPSYKATRNRAQSPKGRAALLRAWARLSSRNALDRDGAADLAEVESALSDSLSTCLSCKACTTLCPVKVDIPSMKSRFLERRYLGRRRPIRHSVLARMETMLAAARLAPGLADRIAQAPVFRWITERLLGLADLPRMVTAIRSRCVPVATAGRLEALSADERARTVVLVEDSFVSTFDGGVLDAAIRVLERTGYRVLRLPARPNGKILHVLGLRARFGRIARARVRECAALEATGVRLVGLDAATALMHEQEYREFVPAAPTVIGLEQLLHADGVAGRFAGCDTAASEVRYTLLTHCTEQALRPSASATWTAVLAHFGIQAESRRTGCCGMAGLFGHEVEHAALSRRLFDLSWRTAMETAQDAVLATGFSCRSQAKRLAGVRPRHPIELLDSILSGRDAAPDTSAR